YGALFVSQGFDVGNLKAAVFQIALRSLQRAVQFILQLRHLFWRRQNSRVHLISQFVAGLAHQLNLRRCRRHRSSRLVVEPASRREQNKNDDGDYGQIVLPGTALIRPEKNSREKLSRGRHFQSAGIPSTITPSRICTTRSKYVTASGL